MIRAQVGLPEGRESFLSGLSPLLHLQNGIPDVEYPRSPGHEKEWFNAMRDSKKPAMSNFPDYSGPLTETILLGNLAVYKRGRVEWDPVNLKPLNDPMLSHIVRPTFRDGYEV